MHFIRFHPVVMLRSSSDIKAIVNLPRLQTSGHMIVTQCVYLPKSRNTYALLTMMSTKGFGNDKYIY